MKKNPYTRQFTEQGSVSQEITSKSCIAGYSIKSLLADNKLLVDVLRKHPNLIAKFGKVQEIYFPQWTPFKIFYLKKLYLLYEGKMFVFFSSSIDTIKWELIDRHYYYEQANKANGESPPK